MYTVTKPVSTHTNIDRALRVKVAATAKRYGVSQAAVFNTALADGLRTARFEAPRAARRVKRTTRRK